MLVQKTNPIGIDKTIDFLQTKLNANSILSAVSYDNLPRAYKNPKANKAGFVPELYRGNGNYSEVLMNDNVVITSFFIADDVSNYTDEIETEFALIVQCSDLTAVYPSITHRADEELKHTVMNILQPLKAVKVINIETSIDLVYREFDREFIKFDDMGSFFVFRINMSTRYGIQCCEDC